MTTVDARGLSCPQPVLLTKEALAARPGACRVLVDNAAARENVSRFAAHEGYLAEIYEENGDVRIELKRK